MIRELVAFPWTAIAAARVALYRSGRLATQELPWPAISVGALEMGGTGKTPSTVAVAEALQRVGMRPAIVSRGYGRTGTTPLLVSEGNGDGPRVNASRAGDEPWLMAHQLRDVPVAVAAKRELAAALLPVDKIDVVVLDDAFQHVRVCREVDLVVVDATRPFWSQSPPPLGRLREGAAAATRADGFLIRGTVDVMGDRWDKKPRLELTAHESRLLPLTEWLCDPDSTAVAPVPETAVAFAGIAKPQRFFRDLAALGTSIELAQQYRDHQVYTATEINGLGERARLRDCDALITTEKDAARLAHLTLDGPNILVATYRLALQNEATLLELYERSLSRKDV